MKSLRFLAGTLTLTMVVALSSGSCPLQAALRSASPSSLAADAAGSSLCDRLAVGVPGESYGTISDVGVVQILPGSIPDGLCRKRRPILG